MKQRIVLGNCSHWWAESCPDDIKATSPRVCTMVHAGESRRFVVGKSPQLLDLVEVAYVDLPFVERAAEYWPQGCVPS